MLSTLTKERMETLRYEAQERLFEKFHIAAAPTRGRDYFFYQNKDYDKAELRNALRNLQTERKSLGQLITSVTKEAGRDEMSLLAMAWSLNRKHPTRFDWFGNYARRKFGDEAINKLRWKDHWQEPVWADEHWFRSSKWKLVHQVHQSEDDPTQIAYNRNIDNIRRDIQTRTKPGKYLTQFFSDVLTQDEIRHWAERQIAHAACEAELKYIENDDEDGWVEVYENGPNSCMQGEDAVKVYAYPNNGLRLAYLEAGDCIVARAIVRDTQDKETIIKGYVRVYATETRWETKLRDLLAAAGYDRRINLHGVKLQRITTDHEGDDGVLCPYIDAGDGGTQSVTIYDDYLKIERNGEIRATNTCGSIPLRDGERCDDCGDYEHQDDMTYVESCECSVCQHCLDNNYTYAHGRRYQDYYPNEDVIQCESDGEWYVTEYASNHDIYECRVNGNWYHIDDLVCVDKGEYEGDYIHVDEAVQLSNDEGWAYEGDCTQLDNGDYILTDDAADCYITGDTIDIRQSVAIEIGQLRTNWNINVSYTKRIFIGYNSWNLDIIRENFVRCGDLLLPRGYYGNEINNVEEPSNIVYGDEFDGEKYEDIFVEEAEELLAA